MDTKEQNKREADIEWKDLYKEHPIRFVLAALIFGFWFIKVLGMQIVNFDIIGFLISTCIAAFGMWLAYGPINYHRVKRHKEIEVTTEYVIKKNASESYQKGGNFCTNCGTKLEKEWSHCPKCGQLKR